MLGSKSLTKAITMNNSAFVRNIIAKALGALWILDGLLQLQPKMFGVDFINNVLNVNLYYAQPAILHSLIAFGISLWSAHPILANTAAAIVQVAIGILLWFPPLDKKFRIGL